MSDGIFGWGLGSFLAWVVFGFTAVGLWGCPQYNVYTSRMSGEAELAQANYSKQVAVQTAVAKRDAAKYEAQAEVIRAGGVSQANKIIADGLGGPDGYLHYLFINNLEHTRNQIIYVPTEANLPMLEAGKR